MNKIRFRLFVAGAVLALAAGSVHAQTSIQRLTFSLMGEYQTNIFYTNAVGPLTNEDSLIKDILVATRNVVKAVAIDVAGTNWTTWQSADLVREVNLTNGNEGIFLHTATAQTNVSSFFGGSFSNNFTSEVTTAFPVVTNFPGATNFPGSTNVFMPQLLLNRGWLRMTEPTNTTTNLVGTGGLYFISLNTTNLKFNLVAVGDGIITDVSGRINGTLYTRNVNAQYLGTAGAYYLNIATNIFDIGSNPPPLYYSGPMHGTFITGTPTFSAIQGP